MTACAAVLAVTGCTTIAPPTPPSDWPARRVALQALGEWTLDGRIAVAAGEEGFSGGFDWEQRGERADIAFSGPMGGAAMTIHVEGDKAVITSGGDERTDEDANELIARYFGSARPLPVHEMRYWLLGAPAPGAPHEEVLGADSRLASLAQAGWQVRYDRYRSVGAHALPAKIEMTTEGLRLRVVVADWRIAP
jgi:outer membrane lipoprotein LolB